MDREEAIKVLTFALMQCGMMMPIEWVKANGKGSEFDEAFQMAIAALQEQEQSKWISVKERLPEKSGEYLVVSEKGQHIGVLDYSAVHKAFNADDDFDDAQYAVSCTHWRPLPEPPKEGAEG